MKKYSAKEISQVAGVSVRTVRDWFAGNATPKPVSVNNQKDVLSEMRAELKNGVPMKAVKRAGTKGETLVVHLTDWHIGRHETDINGTPVYSVQIAKERAELLCSKMLLLAKEHISVGTKLTEVVVAITGDMVDGEGIFDGQSYQLECVPPQQVMECVKLLRDFLLGLRELNLPINVYAVKGNHGRTGKDKSPQSNWDLMAYMILEDWIKTNSIKGIAMYHSETDYYPIDIQGHGFLLRHKGTGQVESPSGARKVQGWANIHHIEALVCGHLHHFAIGEETNLRLFMGGSLKGTDEFSESLAKGCNPTQLMWGVTKRHLSSFLYIVDTK
jgi:predicted phosphodiesterase